LGAHRSFWHAVVSIPAVTIVAHVTHNLRGRAFRGLHIIAYRRTGIPCRQTVIPAPAPVHIITIVTDHVTRSTHSWCRGVACRGADSACRHAVVSIPAAAMHTHVTRNVCSRAVGWEGTVAGRGADGAFRHAVVAIPTPTSHTQVTHHVSIRADNRGDLPTLGHLTKSRGCKSKQEARE